MTAGPWVFTNSARPKILDSTFRIMQDTWKCALLTSSSNISAASTTWAGVTGEHANQNGYTTGGVTVTFSLSGTTSVDINWVSPPYWLATAGNIVARRAAVYESGGDVFAFCLLDVTDVDVTLAPGSGLVLGGTPFNLS